MALRTLVGAAVPIVDGARDGRTVDRIIDPAQHHRPRAPISRPPHLPSGRGVHLATGLAHRVLGVQSTEQLVHASNEYGGSMSAMSTPRIAGTHAITSLVTT